MAAKNPLNNYKYLIALRTKRLLEKPKKLMPVQQSKLITKMGVIKEYHHDEIEKGMRDLSDFLGTQLEKLNTVKKRISTCCGAEETGNNSEEFGVCTECKEPCVYEYDQS